MFGAEDALLSAPSRRILHMVAVKENINDFRLAISAASAMGGHRGGYGHHGGLATMAGAAMMAASRPDVATSHVECAMSAWRRWMLLLCLWLAPWGSGTALAQPSALDVIAGTVIQIDGERGTVTLRHAPIAHLHLPAATTTFRYFNPAIVLRIRVGDAIVFRADRYDGNLRLMAVFPAPSGAAR